MNIDVTFRHMDSSKSLMRYASERVATLERYFDQIQDVHIVLSAERKHHIAEVTVHSPGEIFKATASTEDMHSTLDSVMAKLERHFRRRKEIVKTNSHRSPRAQFPLAPPESADSGTDYLDEGMDLEAEVEAYTLVRDEQGS
jgi:putative sigma-54 modulation protein